MSQLLTNRQAEELYVLSEIQKCWIAKLICDYSHKSIIAYFSSIGLPNAAATLRTDLHLGEDTFDVATSKRYEGLLEKKWTSVVRLQRKVGLPATFYLVIIDAPRNEKA